MDYQAEYWKSKYIESLEDNSKLYGQLADVRLKINSLHEQLGLQKCGPEETKAGSILVLLNEKPVWLDLENLKDEDLCMRSFKNGSYETKTGEQHFAHYKAPIAAEKQGKRLFTREEQFFISTLPCRMDNKRKGRWFTFNLVEGGTIELFFPAAGFRNSSSGSLYNVGRNGFYWNASPLDRRGSASSMQFDSSRDTVNVIFCNNAAAGFSVRCVKDLNYKII
jgi:hypothetical protein